MPDPTLDNRSLLRRSLVAAGVMVSASVAVVGMLTFAASAVADRVVAPPGEQADHGSAGAAAPGLRRIPGARPSSRSEPTAK